MKVFTVISLKLDILINYQKCPEMLQNDFSPQSAKDLLELGSDGGGGGANSVDPDQTARRSSLIRVYTICLGTSALVPMLG